jgi:hypothetical protein
MRLSVIGAALVFCALASSATAAFPGAADNRPRVSPIADTARPCVAGRSANGTCLARHRKIKCGMKGAHHKVCGGTPRRVRHAHTALAASCPGPRPLFDDGTACRRIDVAIDEVSC